jgi:hypothetical protein
VSAALEPAPVSVRVKLAALWTSMLFVFAYVDIFGLYRADVRADLDTGKVGGFDVGQLFLLGTTAYVVIPALMVFATLVLRAPVARVVSLVVAAVYAITIVAAAIGEWNYYLFASAVEIALLAGVGYYAWTWPRLTAS